MRLDETTAENEFGYFIIEDVWDVPERIQREMEKYNEWKFVGSARSVKSAIKEIAESKPYLIFCDWDLAGGSGFEVLQYIQNMQGYDPFIIFNTGFQSDHPEIAEELVNTYRPDAYITKPYWHKLTQQLPGLLKKAEQKIEKNRTQCKAIWLTDSRGEKFPIEPQQIICIMQSVLQPRAKVIYTEVFPEGKDFVLTWKEIVNIMNNAGIKFFVTNKRYSIVIGKFIESYIRPMVYLKKIPFKVEIVEDYIKEFEEWLPLDGNRKG